MKKFNCRPTESAKNTEPILSFKFGKAKNEENLLKNSIKLQNYIKIAKLPAFHSQK